MTEQENNRACASTSGRSHEHGFFVREKKLLWGTRTYVMAVVNVTPDSFSGDGSMLVDDCVEQALRFVDEGADIIDVGGESTRPGYTPVDEDAEIARVAPVVEALRKRSDCVISVDTQNPTVFAECARLGADIFNSVAGYTDRMANTAVESQAPLVIMHQQSDTNYERDMVECVCEFLGVSAGKAMQLGIRPEHVILDPGIGFGKTPQQNIALLRSLERIKALGFPVMIGTSRKSTLGKITGRPVQERAFATAATVALSIRSGADIVRVHDIAAMVDVVKVSDAIVRGWSDWEDE